MLIFAWLLARKDKGFDFKFVSFSLRVENTIGKYVLTGGPCDVLIPKDFSEGLKYVTYPVIVSENEKLM
jgi:hypothetical protein